MPKAKEEKEYADTYEITEQIRIGRHVFVLGVDETRTDAQYIVADRRSRMDGMFFEYTDVAGTNDYLEALGELAARQQAAVQELVQQRMERGSDGVPFTYQECVPGSELQNYEGKIMALKPSFLSPEFRIKEEQLVLPESGFGVKLNGSGTKVYCRDLWSGERYYVRRTDIMGELKPEHTPQWAAQNAELFRAERQHKPARVTRQEER